MKGTRLLAAAGIAAVALDVGPAGAQAPADPVALEEVRVTATRSALPAMELPQGVTLISRAQLARQQPRTVVDHLRGEPGTYVQQTTPGQGVFIVRGLKGSEVLHLVDGFRLNNALFRNAPNQYVALVDPWNLERIEVVRGPLSALHGGDAMGGVASMSTRAPKFEGSRNQFRAKARALWSSADARHAAQLEGEAGNERWVAQLGASWQDARELRVGRGERLPYTGFSSQAAHGRFSWQPAEDQQLTLQAQFSRLPDTSRYDALVAGFGQTQPDSSELTFRPQERRFALIRWRTSAGRFADEAELLLGFQQIVDDRVSRDYGSQHREFEANASSLYGLVGNFSRSIGSRSIGSRSIGSRSMGGKHDLAYGFEIYDDRIASNRRRVDLGNGHESDRPGRFPDGASMRWAGVYAQDRWSPAESWHLTGSARYTTYDIELPPTVNSMGVNLDPADLSLSVGVVHEVSERLNLVANLGRGFRPPNVFDLGTFGARGNRFSVPNSELRPESVVTADMGLKLAGQRNRLELMAFHSNYRDKITQVLTGEVDASGRYLVQSRNATRLSLRGLEAAWSTAVDSLSFRASATYTWGEERFEAGSHPADRIPPLFGRAAADWRLDSRWTLAASLDWAGEQRRLSPRDVVDPRIDPHGTGSWTSFGLRADWRPNDVMRVAFGFDNLADRRYREHGSGFDSPGRNAFADFEWDL